MKNQTNFTNFKNLQPIMYLKKFNKMLDYYTHNTSKQMPRRQLKLIELSKFPLPQFYSKMEGIFESINRQKPEVTDNNELIENRKEEEFLAKHNKFVKKTINTIIQDTEKQQINLQRYKQNYQPHPEKLMSQLRGKVKSQILFKSSHKNVSRSRKISKQKTLEKDKNKLENEKVSILQLEKKQSYKMRNNGGKAIIPRITTEGKDRHQEQTERASVIKNRIEEHQQFEHEIGLVQKDQSERQRNFSLKVDQNIEQFHNRLNKQIKMIKNLSLE